MQKYLTEFIGTFFLVLTIYLSLKTGMAPAELAPLAIGSVLMVMVYMGGHISGAHYNPAVSLAVLIRGKLGPVDFAVYVLVQFAGAVAAAYAGKYLTQREFLPAPPAGVKLYQSLLVEGLFTFALALVVLQTATNDQVKGNSFYGLAIGFTVMAGAIAAGPISGAAFNPAVGVGPNLVLAAWDHIDWVNVGIYLVGPFAGGIVAAIVYKIQTCCT